MAVTNLKCRECGAEYALDARYVCTQCFGPLEVEYDHSALDGGDVELAAPPHPGRPAEHLALRRLPAARGRPAGPAQRGTSRVGLPAGCTPLIRADRLAERLGLEEVWVKNDAANPTHSFKDRVVSVARHRARELGFETLACASTGNLANAVAAHAAALGMESYVFIPADLEEQKILATGVYGTNLVEVNGNYDDVNRLCTEIAASTTAGRSSTSTCARTTPRAPRRWPTRSPSSSAGTTPDRVVAPIASGSLFTKIAKGFEEWRELGLIEGELPTMNGAQAARLLAGRRRRSQTATTSAARSSRTRSPSRWPSATRPTAPTRSSSPARPAARIDSVTDDEIRAGIRLLAETTGIFTETAGGVTTATLAKLAERGDIDPDERVVLVITGEGLKTLDAVRGTFEAARDRADVRGLRGRVVAGMKVRLMAVTVKIPTQLRAATGGASRSRSRARPSARCSTRSSPSTPSCATACRRRRRPAPLRQRLRRRRGHPLRRRARDAGQADGGEVQILPAVAGG